MRALVTVGGVEFPEPSSYEPNIATIVDSGRNVDGYVVGTVIRSDVAKISLGWKYLTVAEWSAVLSVFQNRFYNDVTFFNPVSGDYETRIMYVSERIFWDVDTGRRFFSLSFFMCSAKRA